MLYRIKVGSITNAQRAKAILKEKGFNPYIVRITNPRREDGCGYAVKLTAIHLNSVLELLDSGGINVIGVDEL